MKYPYAPGSAAAHDRAVALLGAGSPPPQPAYTVLRPAQPYDLATPGTPRGILDVAKAAREGGQWRCEGRFALAVDRDGRPVASLALRLSADAPPRPLKSSHQCRRCGRWLEGEWSGADVALRAELQRQMDAGRCDGCTRRETLQRRAWVVYVRAVDPETGASKWAPQTPPAAILDPTDAEHPVRSIGVIELKCILAGVPYVPPPPRPGPPKLQCPTCDVVTSFSIKTWRPYTKHRCTTRVDSRA